jgi:hypothetical protein
MIKLIRETPKDDIFSRQQWWLAGESYEVLVSYDKPLCYFHITDKTQKKIFHGQSLQASDKLMVPNLTQRLPLIVSL